MAAEHELAALIRQTVPARGQPYTIGRPATEDAAHIPMLVALDLIDDNPYQPRSAYDAERIAAIAASIAEHGLLQTPIARRVGDRYDLAFGHSRLRAFQQLAATDGARFGQMPLLIRDLDDETMALHAWTENKDRKDLSAYEEAAAIARYVQSFGWTQQQAAEKLKLDRSTIANKLRLLKLPPAALDHLAAGALSERQAMALLPLAELPQAALARTDLRLWSVQVGAYITGTAALMAFAPKLDSATLRKLVEALLDILTIKLSGAEWAARDCVDMGDQVHAAICRDCPIRLKTSNRCPDAACAERKQEAYAIDRASAAAASVGLPAAAPRGGRHDNLDGVRLASIQKTARETGCGTLAVAHAERGYYPHKVADFPDCAFVCHHGPHKTCACRRALQAGIDPLVARKVEERQKRQRIKTVYMEPTVAALAQALQSPESHTALMQRMLRYHARKDQERAAQQPEHLPAILAAALAREVTKYDLDYGANESGAQQHLAELLAVFGVAVPWEPQAE